MVRQPPSVESSLAAGITMAASSSNAVANEQLVEAKFHRGVVLHSRCGRKNDDYLHVASVMVLP